MKKAPGARRQAGNQATSCQGLGQALNSPNSFTLTGAPRSPKIDFFRASILLRFLFTFCSKKKLGPSREVPISSFPFLFVFVFLCLDESRFVILNPLAPLPPQNVSLTGVAGADKNEEGGTPPQKKNISLRGARVDFPECQERRRGKRKKHKKIRVFLKASPVFGWRREKKENDSK